MDLNVVQMYKMTVSKQECSAHFNQIAHFTYCPNINRCSFLFVFCWLTKFNFKYNRLLRMFLFKREKSHIQTMNIKKNWGRNSVNRTGAQMAQRFYGNPKEHSTEYKYIHKLFNLNILHSPNSVTLLHFTQCEEMRELDTNKQIYVILRIFHRFFWSGIFVDWHHIASKISLWFKLGYFGGCCYIFPKNSVLLSKSRHFLKFISQSLIIW